MKYIAILVAFLCCGVAPPDGSEYLAGKSQVLEALRPVLGPSGSARLDYASSCVAKTQFPPLPPAELQRPSSGSVLTTFRRMFARDANAAVTERANGIIVIKLGKTIDADAILKTRIRAFNLTPLGQYNAQVAIWALEGTKEVKAATSAAGLHYPPEGGSLLLTKPTQGAPHLPSLLKDITVDQALDLIANTFRGLVLFGYCAHDASRSLLIGFAGWAR